MEGNFSVSLKCRISRKLSIGLGVSTRSQMDRRTNMTTKDVCLLLCAESLMKYS